MVCFFLITGYLTIPSRIKRTGVQYGFNRAIRLFPEYWLLLIILFLIVFPKYNFLDLLFNMTMFQEFLGHQNILGASWMLPIQLVFFFLVMVLGTKLFIVKEKSIKSNMTRGTIIIGICMVFALSLATARALTNKPFPVAFFLLLSVSILGIYIWYIDDCHKSVRSLIIMLSIFEVGMIISVWLAYHEQFFSYVIAYNLGLLLFLFFKYFNHYEGFFFFGLIKLGNIGFCFFLGADIPYNILKNIYNFNENYGTIILECFLRFILTIIMATLITKFLEKPMLNWGKKMESEIKR